jgi:hypothetical protein
MAAQQWQMKYVSPYKPRILTFTTQRILVRSGKSYSVGAGRGCQMSGIAGKKIGVRRPSRFVLSLPAAPAGAPTPRTPVECGAPVVR